MSQSPANYGKHLSVVEVRHNILTFLLKGSGARQSCVGYAAYPGYVFRWPQGAALSVARVLRRMKAEGLVVEYDGRYQITSKGAKSLQQEDA